MAGKSKEWQAWNIQKFDKFDDRELTAFKLSEGDISDEFKALYEKVEIKEKDGFRCLFLGDIIKDEAEEAFIPASHQEELEDIEAFESDVEYPEDENPPEFSEPDDVDEIPDSEIEEPEDDAPEEVHEEPETAPPEPVVPEADPEIIEAIKEQAYAEGFEKGEADGQAASEAAITEKVNQLGGIISEIENIWPQMVSDYEEQLLSLVCKISEKVVLGHVAINHEVIKRSILEAFRILPEPETITIHLNSEDYEYIETVKEDIFKDEKSLKQISVISDPSIKKGGCLIESEKGGIDATLESRLEAVKKSIIEAGKTTT